MFDISILNNSIIIAPNSLRMYFLYLKTKNPFLNFKFSTLNELQNQCFGITNEESLIKCLHQFKLSYRYTKTYLDYIGRGIGRSNETKTIDEMRQFLFDNNLIFVDPTYKNLYKNKKVFICGYSEENSELKHIIQHFEIVDIKYLKIDEVVAKGDISKYYYFNSLDEEVHELFIQLSKNFRNHQPITLICSESKYKFYLESYANKYNFSLKFESKKTMFDTLTGKLILSHLDEPSLIDFMKNNENLFKNKVDYESILNIFIKYDIDNLNKDYAMIKAILSSYELNKDLIENEINVSSSLSFDPTSIYYLLDASDNGLPKSYLDTDLLSDEIKEEVLLETSKIKNLESKEEAHAFVHFKNLVSIYYHKYDTEGTNFESNFLDTEGIGKAFLKTNDLDYSKSVSLAYYSKFNYLFNLFRQNSQEYWNYKTNFGDLKIYDFAYKMINCDIPIDYKLSYTSMNSFYSCPFKFYCENVLKLNQFTSSFYSRIGNYAHKIMEDIKNPDFDFDAVAKKYEYMLEFTPREKLFLQRINMDLKAVSNMIKNRVADYDGSFVRTADEEKIDVEFKNNVVFTGKIDRFEEFKDSHFIVYDYKTGEDKYEPKLNEFGLKLQLPTYAFLISSKYKNAKVFGLLYQHLRNYDVGVPKFDDEKFLRSLDMTGIYVNDTNIYEKLDPLYSVDGASVYFHPIIVKDDTGDVLSNNKNKNEYVLADYSKMNDLIELTKGKIDEMIDLIIKKEFVIAPVKYKKKMKLSCDYCDFKDVCYVVKNRAVKDLDKLLNKEKDDEEDDLDDVEVDIDGIC